MLVPGFENCKMFRPGYAIEYDYFPPTQLKASLETKLIKNLFFAGQINGTTGYEEAACQGLMAGINAYNATHNAEPLVLKRSEAYIGVLIDDLINKGTDEPYRMFTSRAEYRTLLRQDNADLRLTKIGYKLGLASQKRVDKVIEKESNIKNILNLFNSTTIEPTEAETYLLQIGSSKMVVKQKLAQLLLRPSVSILEMLQFIPSLSEMFKNFDRESLEQTEIQTKYDTYLQKEQELVNKMSMLENLQIPSNFDYEKLVSLSTEAKQKFKKIQPQTLGQASRISGVNPSDVQILMIYMGR